jgi:hypothetical protein
MLWKNNACFIDKKALLGTGLFRVNVRTQFTAGQFKAVIN